MLWLALAACYADPPQGQLHIKRGNEIDDVVPAVCPATDGTCRCITGGLFRDPTERERDVAIYAPTGTPLRLVVSVTTTNASYINSCLPVTFGEEMQTFDVDISSNRPWGSPDETVCLPQGRPCP